MAPCFYLVRHAKAEKAAPSGDAGRPLSAGGRDAFRDLVASLGDRLAVTRVVSSPLLRARQTGELLAGATGAPVEQRDELSSGDLSGRRLLRLGLELGAGAALVGHNPELGEAIALAAGAGTEVPPGTIAAVDLDGRLVWLVRPSGT